MKKVLLFAGSNSSKSINRKVIEHAAALLDSYETKLIDLRDFPLPFYSEDVETEEGIPENAHKLRELFQEYDGLVVSVAEHNGSVTAFLKNSLDWVSRSQRDYGVLKGKSVWLFSTSPGRSGGADALANAETIFSRLSAKVAGKAAIASFYHTEKETIRVQIGKALANIEEEISETRQEILV